MTKTELTCFSIDLFFSTRDRNPWNLIKYYLLKPDTELSSHEEKNDQLQQNQEHKHTIVNVGRRIFNSYLERKGEDRFKKEVLDWLQVIK